MNKISTRNHSGHSRFAAHGHVEVWAEGQLLRYQATGPFNLELLQALDAADRGLMAATAAQGPFAILAEFAGSIAATPEALAALEGSLAAQNEAGLATVAVAYVVDPQAEGAEVMRSIIDAIYARQQLRFGWFQDLTSAQRWLTDCLSSK
ncbi:hypothetical protein [Chitinilyticum piscinae]|uniref:Uncharacterized protein n=1 Tax=Chitinilyticum piscinae TaxID=2866724 RepID=A0A8J7FP15_9NEIS|nr:hypothetical protein [Chitinilyticum piscinae]MBE9610381.1 hypothetical protein [Chitinilyticum piscinae]